MLLRNALTAGQLALRFRRDIHGEFEANGRVKGLQASTDCLSEMLVAYEIAACSRAVRNRELR